MARDITPAPAPVSLPRGTPVGVIAVPDDVKVDIDEGPSVTIDQDGPHATRVARVFGLRGTPSARLWYATQAPGVPQYGDHHPWIEFLPVSRVHAVLASEGTTDIATVTIDYGFSPGGVGSPTYFDNEPSDTALPQLEVLTTVQLAQTQFDVNRVQIVVSRIIEDPDTQTSTVIEQAGSVDYQLPMETVRYMRREVQNPQGKARLYVGTINGTGVFNDGPHYWMCTRLDGVSDDGGATFNVTYEFQRNPDSWDPWIIFTDPETGKPVVLTPEEATSGETVKQVVVYRQMDFWALNLTLPGAGQ